MPSFAHLLVLVALGADAPAPPSTATVAFDAPKFGVKVAIPSDWTIAARENDDGVFVAIIKQRDPRRPGVAACEIGLAPECLHEYRTRIEASAKRGGHPGGKLVRNEVVRGPKGERLESLWEFRPISGGVWHELTVRVVAHRQMYSFMLNIDVEDAAYAKAKPAFDTLVDTAQLSPPNTGADLFSRETNRWVQREFKFAIDLPENWSPVLAPSEVALFFANGPANGIWSDNVLVLAQPHRDFDLEKLAREYPDRLRQEEPNCEVLACTTVKQGKRDALETVVRTRRGPFSMTVLERRFRGERFDYEVKYTVESKRFSNLAPKLRKSLDSFEEISGSVPTDKAS